MKIPFKPSLMQIRRKPVRYIILHHTIELYKIPKAKVDNQDTQISALQKGVLELKQADINYNFVIDKVGEDYNAITCRPPIFLCDWDDIDALVNNRALHVALMGSYDLKQPEKRMYEVLAYRVLNPFMKMFNLTTSKIKFHRDVSIEDITCPGKLLNKDIVIAQTKKYLIK